MDEVLKSLLNLINRLPDEFRELRECVHLLPNLVAADPEMALTRARKALEFTIADHFARRVGKPSRSITLDEMLTQLGKGGHLPDVVELHAHGVRAAGNVGVHRHGAKVTAVEVTTALTQLRQVLKWYFEEERPGLLVPEAVRPIPPAVEHAPQPSRLREKPPICVGRDALLKKLESLFLPPDDSAALPKLPLAGVGGIGKSTAVLWFLHDNRVQARYGDRRHFVPLDGVTSRGALVAKLAEYLGVPLGPELESRVVRLLEGGERRLVVLDNAETPLLSDDRLGVEELLQHLARIALVGLIATLRPDVPIGLGWLEAELVKPLPPPPAREVFLRNTSGKFGTDPDLDGLLGNLEGWPLVIRLAAERAKSYPSIKQFRGVWEKKRAELLKLGADRGTNFAVSVGLSLDHQRMTDPARRLLAIVARLPDGARHDDLDGLLPGDAVEAAVTLREVGGLVFDDRDRVRMLAPLRDHLVTSLQFDGNDRKRVVEFYCRVAEGGEKAGRSGGAEAIIRVSTDAENCRVMIRLGLNDSDSEPAFRAALGFGEVARFTGADGQDMLIEAAERARTIGNDNREADCIRMLGEIARLRSTHAQAISWFGRALQLYRQLGSVVGEANCIKGLGDTAFYCHSDHAVAVQQYEHALTLYQLAADVLGEAYCMARLGEVAGYRSDFPKAARCYSEARGLFNRIGYVAGEAGCVLGLGEVALSRSDHQEARQWFEEALLLYREIQFVLGEANCVWRLGQIASERSDHAEARRRYEEALPLYQRFGSTLGEANCIRCLGDISLRQPNCVEARRRYEEALPLYQRIGDVLGEANCIRCLGDISRSEGDTPSARGLYEDALARYRRIEEPFSIGWTFRRLARIADNPSELGRFVAAAREAWLSIDRPDLIAELDAEFPPEPGS